MLKLKEVPTMSKQVKGIPSLGGKTRLAETIRDVIYEQVEAGNVSKFYDVCGGGGKLSFALNHMKFDFMGYNEWEFGLATLMNLLQKQDNIIILNTVVTRIIKSVLAMDFDATDEEKFKALFDVAKKYVVCGPDKLSMLDPILVGALAIIVIWGSYQNNRNTIFYKYTDKNNKVSYNFLDKLLNRKSYMENLMESHACLKYMEVRNEDCFDIIKEYQDDEQMILVIDPPYFNTECYKNSWSYSKHKELIALCKDCKCKIMICMHQAGLIPYKCLFESDGWHCYGVGDIIHDRRKSNYDITRSKTDSTVNQENAENMKKLEEVLPGIGNILSFSASVLTKSGHTVAQLGKVAQEYIWCNFKTSKLTELFEADTQVGYKEYDCTRNYKITDGMTVAQLDRYFLEQEKNSVSKSDNLSYSMKQLRLEWAIEKVVGIADSKFSFAEVCSGAGGLSLGMHISGFKSYASVEFNKQAVETQIQNFGKENVILGDITKDDTKAQIVANVLKPKVETLLEQYPETDKSTLYKILLEQEDTGLDVFCGGIPCTSYSNLGKREHMNCDSGMLFDEYLKIAECLKPKVLFIENVQALVSAEDSDVIEYMLAEIRKLGYFAAFQENDELYSTVKVLNAADYGVPQNRLRVFIVAIRQDIYDKAKRLGVEYKFPEPILDKDNHITLKKAIKGLPDGRCIKYSPNVEHVLASAKPGKAADLKYFDKSLLDEDGEFAISTKRFRRYRRLDFNKVCCTIAASEPNTICHPKENRPLNENEIKRIQTFPDDFKFAGGIHAVYKQIGNAVPVFLAKFIGQSISDFLKQVCVDV